MKLNSIVKYKVKQLFIDFVEVSKFKLSFGGHLDDNLPIHASKV